MPINEPPPQGAKPAGQTNPAMEVVLRSIGQRAIVRLDYSSWLTRSAEPDPDWWKRGC